MAQQTINIGTVANDGTGDDLRVAMQKVNDNFTELYGASPVSSQITISGNQISSNATNANLKLTASGTGVIEFEGVQIRDNHMEATRSNDDLILGASGTGNVIIEGIRINGTEISSDDSSQITLKENVLVTGNFTSIGTLNASTVDVNVIQSSDSTAVQINESVHVSGELRADSIDTNTISNSDSSRLVFNTEVQINTLVTTDISSDDSTRIRINDALLVDGALQVNGSLGFFGTTPIAQQSAIAFDPLANDGSTVDDLRQIINQMLVVMRNYGLIAS